MRLIVYTPPYTEKSFGIHLLHATAAELKRQGFDARVLEFSPEPRWGREVSPENVEGAIVVYPEIVTGHPLAPYRPAKTVRYFLNRDGLLLGEKVRRGPDDVVWSLSRMFHPTAPVLFYPHYDASRFNLDGALPIDDRTELIAYQGKHTEFVVPPMCHGQVTHWVTRESHGQSEWAAMLRRARFLFTADSATAATYEALLCGCAPIVTHWGAWTVDDLCRHELPEVGELNREHDWSPKRAERARQSMLGRLETLKDEWPSRLREMVESLA
jgi:hypothetical protein